MQINPDTLAFIASEIFERTDTSGKPFTFQRLAKSIARGASKTTVGSAVNFLDIKIAQLDAQKLLMPEMGDAIELIKHEIRAIRTAPIRMANASKN